MQFRAGVLYIVLFLVIAAGAYGVIATAEPPEATINEADADYVLSAGETVEIGGETYNVSDLGADSGTLESVETGVTLEQTWEDGDTVMLDEESEYTLSIDQPGSEDDEEANESAQPESFTLTEAYDEEEYETVERDDGVYVIVSDGDTDQLVPIEEFEEIDTRTYEVGDSIEYYNDDEGALVEAEVATITAESVTVEYIGEEVTEISIDHEETVTIGDQEFVAYFPSDEQVYLSSNVEQFQQQQASVDRFNERVSGFQWVIAFSIITAILMGGLAFMPVRG